MSDNKPVASLSSSLLARKGDARPAMRRPKHSVVPGPGFGAEDLGWNDMGYDVDPENRREGDKATPNVLKDAIPEPVPGARAQQEEIARKLGARSEAEAKHVSEPADAEEAPRPNGAVSSHGADAVAARVRKKAEAGTIGKRQRKAAFTLRIDPERHLRLRLACALGGVSAQQFVTDALDRHLDRVEGLDDLAEKAGSANNQTSQPSEG